MYLRQAPMDECIENAEQDGLGMEIDDGLMGLGREVVYNCGRPDHILEKGVISAVNHQYIFVRFGNADWGQACRPDTLTFIDDLPEGTPYK